MPAASTAYGNVHASSSGLMNTVAIRQRLRITGAAAAAQKCRRPLRMPERMAATQMKMTNGICGNVIAAMITARPLPHHNMPAATR